MESASVGEGHAADDETDDTHRETNAAHHPVDEDCTAAWSLRPVYASKRHRQPHEDVAKPVEPRKPTTKDHPHYAAEDYNHARRDCIVDDRTSQAFQFASLILLHFNK